MGLSLCTSQEAARPFVTDEIYKKVKHPYTAPFKYGIDGPLHRLMRRLVTEENIKELGFVEWRPGMLGGGSVADLVEGAFGGPNEREFRLVVLLAQWVVLGKKFGVARSESGFKGLVEGREGSRRGGGQDVG